MIPAVQRRSLYLIYFLFILSGLTSLVYEIVWSRILSTILGNTSLAISIVVSLFMAGLAAGSILAARWRHMMPGSIQRKPLAVYGALELLIGLYSLCTPWLSDLVNVIYGSFYEEIANRFWLSVALKASVTAVFFLLPTVAMGATLPVLIRSFSHSERQSKAGRLYGLNTFGAVLGTLLAGYFLIPLLGIRKTVFLAASLNFLISLTAFFLSRSATQESEGHSDATRRATAFHPVYLLVFFTGFASLCFEILWARALSMFFGSSVYAFSAILAAFLLGIATGSSYYSNRISEQTNPYQFFSLIQFRLSLAAMFFVGIFMGIPILLILMFENLNQSFPLFQAGQFLLISSTVFYATFLSGAAFPAALHFFRERGKELHSHTAYIYTYNTIGGIFGSFAAAFFLIPMLGVEGSIRVTVLIHLILGIYCFRKTMPADQDKRVLAIGGVTLILLIVLPYWNKSVYNAGFYAFAYKYVKQGSNEALQHRKLDRNSLKPQITTAGMLPSADFGPDLRMLFYGEGLTATVAVVEDEQGIRSLLINGKPDASNVPTGDMRTQLLLGHLPVLLRGSAENALVIGLGSGVTSGALRTHGIRKIDCVEIENKVALASRYFERENLSILKDPVFRLIVDDGRNVVQHTPVKYDILTSEPSNLWISGVANLFTKEFFVAAKNRLNPDGIMCQWIHLYQISLQDVLIFLKTFQSVFPYITLWIDESDMIVIGSGMPFRPDAVRIQNAMDHREVMKSLLRSNLTAQNIMKKYAGDERIVQALRADLPFNTDNHPILEFSAPKSLFWNRSIEITQSLKKLRELAEKNPQPK